MRLLLRWVLNTLALFVVATLVPGFRYESFVSLAVAALVLGLLNAVVRPILFWLTLPITLLTLGLFLIVLNAILLEIAAFFVPGFDVDGFGWAMVGAVLLSIISLVTNRIGAGEKRE